jgi:predicted carbohydrate-binding protein with CBM5 and CBM33 domain
VTRRILARTAAALAAGGFAAAVGLAPAAPAFAHGAPVQPISRTAACAAGGEDAGAPACKAALAANGRPFGDFDNLRVPYVNGKDRQYIPDGNLCSGDLPEFQGLDIARDDWPATTLTAGGTLTVVYRATIPHRGSFRIYLTKPGYRPTRPLRWSDLGDEPILTADNPPMRDGSYRMSGKLPADRTGRHVLYTIWQTTSTPDTYYSCSDLILKTTGSGAAAPAAKPLAAKATTHAAQPLSDRSPEPGAVADPAEAAGPEAGGGAPAARESWLSKAGDEDRIALGRQIVTAALIVLVGVTGGLAFARIRRARVTQGVDKSPEIR